MEEDRQAARKLPPMRRSGFSFRRPEAVHRAFIRGLAGKARLLRNAAGDTRL
jgi:hypothetical protein